MQKNAILTAGISPCEFCGEISSIVLHGVAVCRMHARNVHIDPNTKSASLGAAPRSKSRCRKCASTEINDALTDLLPDKID